MAGKRNKDQTIQKLLAAVGDILKERGYAGLGVNKIAARAGVNKKLIYYYFQSLNNLIKAYIRQKDYWLPLFDNYQWNEALGKEQVEKLFVDFLVEQFLFFDKETEMQKLILWQVSEASVLMRSTSDAREVEGAKFLGLTDPYFEGSDVDFRSVVALLVGGIYYVVLHAHNNKSTVCGIDTNREKDYQQFMMTIRQVLEWAWKAAEETQNGEPKIGSGKEMKYELTEMENIVQSLVARDGLRDEQLIMWNKLTDKFPKAVMEGVLALEQPKVALYIRWHQEGLVEMANQVYKSLQLNSGERYSLLLNKLEALLEFLNRTFQQETNSYVTLPDKQWDSFKPGLTDSHARLTQTLARLKIDAALTEICLIPLSNYMGERHGEPPAYQHFRYLVLYISELDALLESGAKVNQDMLLQKLIELNFNHLRVFHYWINMIEKELKQYPGKADIVLKKLKRRIVQLPQFPAAVYNDHATSMKEQLNRWIEEEICLIGDEALLAAGISEPRRVKVNLPVGALAYWYKLLYKHHYFAEENQTLIIRHATDHYSSIDTEQVSTNSFASKYRMKQPSDTAARAIRKLIKPILEEVDKVLS